MNTLVNSTELKMHRRRMRFSEALKYYMHEANISTDKLASKCGINPYLIRKVLVTDDNRRSAYIPFTLPIVLGIGLELAPSDIHFLLGKAGYTLSNPGEPYNDTLTSIIESPYPKTIGECNSIMERAGYHQLTAFEIQIPEELNKYRRRHTK